MSVKDFLWLFTVNFLAVVIGVLVVCAIIALMVTLAYKWKAGETELELPGTGDDAPFTGGGLTQHEAQVLEFLVLASDLKVSWRDVGGCGEILRGINEQVVQPINFARYHGADPFLMPPKGVLLYGPPGCGKTLIAKAMAAEINCQFLSLDMSTVKNKWLGETEKLVAAIFSLAHKIQPCIIFLDEIDAFLGTRTDDDHAVEASVKALFLQLWDGLHTDPTAQILVLGATNRKESVDPSILRRMPLQFEIPPPGENERREILEIFLKSSELAIDVDLAEVARMTEGFTGSDLQEVCRCATVLRMKDFMREHCLQPHSESLNTFHRRHHPVVLRPVTMGDIEKALSLHRLSIKGASGGYEGFREGWIPPLPLSGGGCRWGRLLVPTQDLPSWKPPAACANDLRFT